MKPKRKFSKEFKRIVVEELVSKTSTLGQLSRRHNISAGLISNWKNQYAEGKLAEIADDNNDALRSRIEQLEKMIGRLTMDNELLKKATQFSLQKKNASSSVIISGNGADLEGGAK
jgi:transposase